MHNKSLSKLGFAGCVAVASAWSAMALHAAYASAAHGGAPEAAFRAPESVRRPETYFFFFGGNVAAPGITADLEAVKSAGIAGIKLFNGDSARGAWPGVPKQIACLSPEWDALVGRFGDECRRLDLRMAMQVCPGWAMAGGPWIKPEHAMRHLAVSRTDVEGARAVRVKLPQPPHAAAGWQDWRDIAVIAFRAPDGDWERPLAPSSVTGSSGNDWNAWARGRAAAKIPANATTEIVYEFARPVTVRTLELPPVKSLAAVTQSFDPGTTVSLKAEDGATLVEDVALPPSSWQDERPLSLACRETTARRFTLTVKNRHPITLRTAHLLSAAKKDNWEGEACWTLRRLLRRDAPAQSKGAYVESASVMNLTGLMAPDGTLAWDAPPGRWAVLRIGHVNTGVKNAPAPPEGTGFECDKFSTQAADIQFDSYIGRLTRPGAPLCGKLRAMLMDSWECGHQTWTPGMDAIFSSRLGYDLFTWIPAVFGYVVDSPNDTARFLDDWRTLVSDLITDNFFGHMAKRARERGMEVEFEAAFGNSIPGDIMKYYKYADTPMCEFWQPAVSFNFTPVKPIISAAHVYGKRGVGAEAFTSFGVSWNEKLRDYKHNANMNLAEGISHFVFHTFTHNPQEPWLPPGTSFGGLGVGAPFVRGQTWWKHMKAFTDYFARCQTMLEAGVPVIDVLWYLGDECDGRPDHYAPFPAGHKYDYCNPDAFLARIAVHGGKWRTPEGIEYGIVWIPESRRMLPETMEHLAEGIERGGVAALARLPDEPATRRDGAKGAERFRRARERLEKLIGMRPPGGARSPGATHGIPARGRLYVGRAVGDVLKAEGVAPDVEAKGIVWNHRRNGDDDWYFVAPAEDGRGFDGEVAFRGAEGRACEIWHPESGLIDDGRGAGRIRLSLAPAQSCFVVFKRDAATSLPRQVSSRKRVVSVSGPWKVAFPEGWDVPTATTAGELKPWRVMFHESPSARAFSGTAAYETEFVLDEIDGRVVLDLGRVESIARVELNGKTFRDLWAYPYRLDVTSAARRGRNSLRIEVTDTWYNRLVYEGWLPEARRRTWTFRRPSERLPLHDSGLMGPVTLSLESAPRQLGGALAGGAPEAHVDGVVAEVLANVAKIKAVKPDAKPMAFWDFDGTILKGDITEGLEEDGRQKFAGLMEETIKAGLSPVYSGEKGWLQYRDVDYPRMNAIGRWLAWPYNAQVYEGVEERAIVRFCEAKVESVYRKWYFASSMAIWRALEKAGVENYVVSASPEVYVKSTAKSLGVSPSRVRAIRVEVEGGRMTTKVVHPVPYGEGKVENVRMLLLSRPNGVAVAGFGNSYSTDGAFLRYIVSQPLPGGAKGFALMINGGKEKPGFEGLFRRVEQKAVVGE